MISLTDRTTGASWGINPYPGGIGSSGQWMAPQKYRFNWNAPIVLSPQDPKTVYYGGNVLFRSTNHGRSWDVISPDLTTNDKAKQQSSGGKIVTDNTAAEFHCTIIAIGPSPVDPNVIWAGTDDGNVQVTRDGGKTWTNTVKGMTGLAPNAWINKVDASHFDAGTAYVSASHWQDGDYAPYFYKTADFGRTWTKITGRAARARLVARHPGGPEGARPAVRGHGVRPLRLVERRRRLDVHPQQHPARRRARHRHPPPRQRHHRRHPRARASTSSTTRRRCS